MEYKILKHTRVGELEKLVNHALEEGWQLQGSVSAFQHSSSNVYYLQAIVRKKK